MRALFVIVGLLVGAVTGCQPSASEPAVVCLVAASTQDAVAAVAAQFTRETGIPVSISADSSARLATQIEEHAPADLFLSANRKWADYLAKKDLVAQSSLLLGNDLVIVVPMGNPAAVHQPTDLVGPALTQLALAGENVPAGSYARQALKHLGLWEKLHNRVVPGANVRVALAYVERGEAQAGIVYSTDAASAAKVQAVYTFPPSTHEPIVYPLALLRRGAPHAGAQRFYGYLHSDAARAIFVAHGFRWHMDTPR